MSTTKSFKSKENSKISTDEETSGYTLSKQFLKLDLDKIRECIEILEEHYQKCVEQENINEAKAAKQRITLFKKIEKEKMKKEAKIIYSNQQELVQDKMKEELDSYIATTEQEFQALTQAFESQEVEMLKAHEKEINEFKENFEIEYERKKPRPSKECLNWMKIREYAVKQNNFDKASEAEQEIKKLQEVDFKKYEEQKETKLITELNKIIKRQECEKNGFSLKKQSIIDMFNQTRDKNIEQIQKKYEAKLKELKNYQNFEMSNFDKITKGITKPCSRIQSIVSSTTGIIADDMEDEKDEIKGGEEYEEEEENKENNENGGQEHMQEQEEVHEEHDEEGGEENIEEQGTEEHVDDEHVDDEHEHEGNVEEEEYHEDGEEGEEYQEEYQEGEGEGDVEEGMGN